MALLNEADIVYKIITYITQNITGSEILTYLFILFLILALAALLRLPLELTIPIMLPLLIVFALYTSNLLSVLGVALIYLGIIVAKRWIAN